MRAGIKKHRALSKYKFKSKYKFSNHTLVTLTRDDVDLLSKLTEEDCNALLEGYTVRIDGYYIIPYKQKDTNVVYCLIAERPLATFDEKKGVGLDPEGYEVGIYNDFELVLSE